MSKAKKAAKAAGLKFGSPVKTGTIKEKSHARETVIYKDLVVAVGKLPVGQDLPIDVPGDLTAVKMQNRLNGPLRREVTDPLAPEKGMYLSRRTSADGKQILLRWAKGAKPVKAKSKK